jgi:hypothetical protein
VPGDWEVGLTVFLTGLEKMANQAAAAAKALIEVATEDAKPVQRLGKASGSFLRVNRFLRSLPIFHDSNRLPQVGTERANGARSLKHLAELRMQVETRDGGRGDGGGDGRSRVTGGSFHRQRS